MDQTHLVGVILSLARADSAQLGRECGLSNILEFGRVWQQAEYGGARWGLEVKVASTHQTQLVLLTDGALG